MAKEMSIGYFPTSFSEIFSAGDIVKHYQLSKLVIDIKDTAMANINEAHRSVVCSVYKLCYNIANNFDVRINLECLKTGELPKRCTVDSSITFVADGTELGTESPQKVVVVPRTKVKPLVPGNRLKLYDNVVLGGTFDRLHTGHKILLTEAVMQCKKKLTVGITDNSMIQNKILWELIEPVETRISNVLEFLMDIDNTLKYDVVPISDIYGPTGVDPDLQLLVVSDETVKGGQIVNELRISKGFNPLVIHTVSLIEDSGKQVVDEDKISSSNQRRRLLGRTLLAPAPNPDIPNRPYLIGLTGGIASGKSNIGKKLVEKGAGLVDCDKVAHKLYTKGTPIFSAVVETFGKSVVGPDGEIDRRAVGAIVFNSKEEMDKLNNLLWPAILEASLTEANRLYRDDGTEVVVLEAAVLLRAGWNKHVHQVWTSIIPPAEAVQRIMKRNNLDETAASARVNAQPSNSEQVAIANVVFCSLYSYEYTASQVDIAWNNLCELLKTQTNVANKL